VVRGASTTIAGVLAGLVLAGGACRQLNASHCGNQAGNATCEQRDPSTPFCDRCVAVNDGCVATRVDEPGCGEASSGHEPTTATSTADEGSTTAASSDTADSSSGEPPDPCGNGVIDPGEACDADLRPDDTPDCAALGFGEGEPGCTDDCTAVDYTGCPAYMLCGNGEVGFGEQCDGENLAGKTCDDLPNLTGPGLVCTADCTFNTSACAICRESGQSCTQSDTCCDANESCAALAQRCCVANGLGLCNG
jgi:hypothetical protein